MGKLASLLDRSRTSTWFALLMVFIATRSVIEVWTGSDQGDKYLVVALTAAATATYGLLRFVELLALPGFKMRYLVRSLNVLFMGVILLGEYIFSRMLGRVLVLLALVAIEINLVSNLAEYHGKAQAHCHSVEKKKGTGRRRVPIKTELVSTDEKRYSFAHHRIPSVPGGPILQYPGCFRGLRSSTQISDRAIFVTNGDEEFS